MRLWILVLAVACARPHSPPPPHLADLLAHSYAPALPVGLALGMSCGRAAGTLQLLHFEPHDGHLIARLADGDTLSLDCDPQGALASVSGTMRAEEELQLENTWGPPIDHAWTDPYTHLRAGTRPGGLTMSITVGP